MANFSKPTNMMTMLVAFFSILQVTVAFQHGGHHHSHPARAAAVEHHINEVNGELQKRQSNGVIAITGICSTGTSSSGTCNSGSTAASRIELRDLEKDADAWNLYLLGMERFQSKDKSDPLSYYQVSGIHGRPFKTWNNFPTPLLNNGGFCPHAQTLFGSWHRPFLALYEQAWYQSVQEVIEDFPSSQQQKLKDTASKMRIPYWDWATAIDGQVVPKSMTDKTVTVTKPSGKVTINNPLYSYKFGSSLPAEIGGGPWNSFPETLRRPIGNPTRSNNNEMKARFNAQRVSLRDRLFALFASKADFGKASTSAIGVRTDLSGNGVDSLESVHDVIHNLAGGESQGHMYFLDQSAFDPLFWLHHTNVDRLLAMYQLISPKTYVANGNINHPMAQWNQGEPKNSYSPLKPFTKNLKGDYFSSQDVRETRSLGYYYPETSERSYSQVAKAVSQLYGAGSRTISKRESDGKQISQYEGRPIKEGDYHTVLSIKADKYAIGSYVVHCFLGKSSNTTTIGNSTAPYSNSTSPYSNSTSNGDYDASADFTQDPNYVGAYGNLGGMMHGGGNSSNSVMTEGALPLTTALMGKEHYGELESLAPEHVEPYIADNLHYIVVGPDGELNPDKIPNFHISVKSTEAKPASSDDGLPDFSAPYSLLQKATENLPAGKLFEYIPSLLDKALPDGPEYEQAGQSDSGLLGGILGGLGSLSLPWEEEGYCCTKQTIEYVDPDGKLISRSEL